MTAAHIAALLLILALIALQPREQELRVDMTNAAACEPIDYRTPGYRHPWEPIDDPNKDPRTIA